MRPCCRAYEGCSCAVCLGDYEDGEMIRQLPDCHHHFHQDCIDQWLATHTTCPMCRRSLLPPDPGAPEPSVLPQGSPTKHLLPLLADHVDRNQQHQERAVELLPVGCPSPLTLHVLFLNYTISAACTYYESCVVTEVRMKFSC